MTATCLLWVRARPDYDPFFSILDDLRRDNARRYWIERKGMERNISDIQVDSEQMRTGVEILLTMSQYLDKHRGAYTMMDRRLKARSASVNWAISAIDPLHLYRSIIRFIKSGSKYNFRCPGDFISC